MKSLMRWVRLHPYNIAQKVQIIVEHYKAHVAWRLKGQAKAMVVTSSRKEAVRYKLAIDKYIKSQGYKDLNTLVAFSGEVVDSESGPSPFTETGMNPGLKGRDLRDAFDSDDFQVLLVANKYQTGFDQPKLVAMYVDKKLAGVAAVQTLSRLNRTMHDKDQTFVIDFVNDPEEIKTAFQPYFETAELDGISDPNLIHDLQIKLDASRIYLPEEVEGLVAAFFKKQQGEMQAKVAPAVDRYRVRFREAIDADDKEAIDVLQIFRKDIGGFVRAYDFLSQIVDYADTDLEKRSIYFKHLLPLLKDERSQKSVDLSAVKLTHYRLSDKGQQAIRLEQGSDEYKLQPITGLGSGKSHDPEIAMLAQIIQKMNDLFDGDLTDNDLLALANHVGGKMMENDTLAQQAAANSKEQFGASPDYKSVMMDSVADGLDKYQEMATQVLNSPRVQDGLSEILLELVYAGFAKKRLDGTAPM